MLLITLIKTTLQSLAAELIKHLSFLAMEMLSKAYSLLTYCILHLSDLAFQYSQEKTT